MIFAPVIRRAAYAQAPRSADQALQRFLMGTLAEKAPAQAAACNVAQDDKTTTLQLDVPGLSREQLQITIEGPLVRLNSVEGAPRQVQRAWELPTDIDASASRAQLEHGVLTLTLAHLQPVNKAATLSIQ